MEKFSYVGFSLGLMDLSWHILSIVSSISMTSLKRMFLRRGAFECLREYSTDQIHKTLL